MEHMREKFRFGMAFSFFAFWALSGCGGAARQTEMPHMTIAVASSLEAIASALLEEYSGISPQGAPIEIETIADKDIPAAFATGEISVVLQWQEPSAEEWSAQIGWTGIFFAVHPKNPVGNISSSQARAIYTGLLDRWEDVGGSSGEIHMLAFDTGTPWAMLFDGVVLTEGRLAGSAVIIPSADAMPAAIAADPEAVGYLPMGQKVTGVRILTVNAAAADYPALLSGAYPFRIPVFLIAREPVAADILSFAGWAQSVSGQTVLMELYSQE
jgi:ABC-type phosphate transport system substrate-binding protein